MTVRNVTLIPVGSDGQFTFSDMIFSLQNQVAQGLGSTDFLSANRVYLVFVDQISGGVYPYGGQGGIWNDDSPNPSTNLHQTGPAYSLVNGFSGFVAEHELGHNIGAVQLSAPHSSGAWHCFEENDVMCYADGGPYFAGGGTLVFNCPALPATHFDCGQDDYYNLQPAAGTYLASHWNVSKSAFLTEQVQIACTWLSQDQPDSPLELNTVVVGRVSKTVAMEKEIFRCFNKTDPHASVIRTIDVETFVDIIERASHGDVKAVDKHIEVASCTKDRELLSHSPERVPCDTKNVTLRDVPSPFGGCARTSLPQDPVEMNTVSLLGGELVKTIKVEKEIWDCDSTILDLYLFTEIVEGRSTSGFRPVSKAFEAIICQKERITSGVPPAVRCGTLKTS